MMTELRLISREQVKSLGCEGCVLNLDDEIDELWNSLPLLSDLREFLEDYVDMLEEFSEGYTDIHCGCEYGNLGTHNSDCKYTKAKSILQQIGG